MLGHSTYELPLPFLSQDVYNHIERMNVARGKDSEVEK